MKGAASFNSFTAQGTPAPKLYAVWAFDASNAVAVGAGGVILLYSAATWQPGPSVGVSTNLTGVWGAKAARFWVTSSAGTIFQVENNTVTPQQPVTQPLNAIFGISEQQMYVVGGPAAGPAVILSGGLP